MAALRRVAELVAAQGSSEEVFAVVTRELCELLDVNLMRTFRFESDGTATVLAAHGTAENLIPPGTTNIRLPEGTVIEQVFRTGRPARVDDFTRVGGPIGALLREEGARSGAGGPILVDGRVWGAMAVGSQAALPLGTEDRVAQFAELVSTAISNIESRAKVERLAAEQAALRRVAELVARQATAERVFAVVTEELSRLLQVDMVRTVRFEPDGTATILPLGGCPRTCYRWVQTRLFRGEASSTRWFARAARGASTTMRR
jgi:GAF domain-containing protein